MVRVVELLYVEISLLDFDYSALVVVAVAVVGGREHRDDGGELLTASPVVELVAVGLHFVGSDHAEYLIGINELICGIFAKDVRAAAFLVFHKIAFDHSSVLLVLGNRSVVFFNRVAPHDVAERTSVGDLLQPVELVEVVQHVQGRREAAMQTEVLAIDQGADRESFEGVHYFIVHLLVILVKDFLSESEVTCHSF